MKTGGFFFKLNIYYSIKILLISVLCFCAVNVQAQPNDLQKNWTAQWIAFPNDNGLDYGVFHFRKSFDLTEKTDSFIVHVSADNRYKLYVNGTLVSLGPARSDLKHWNFETVNIAPFLQKGKNTLAAVVWNFGEQRAIAQMGFRTAFLLQGNSKKESIVNTCESWKCIRNSAITPIAPIDCKYFYYVVGPTEKVDMNTFPHGWEKSDFDDSKWLNSSIIYNAYPVTLASENTSPWLLVPRQIPPMEMRIQRLISAPKKQGISNIPPKYPREKASIIIPAHKKASLLLDQTFLTTAYSNLMISAGKGSVIRLGYAESLFEDDPLIHGENACKGKRNETDSKMFFGCWDEIISDGQPDRLWTSLWWRTYRFIQVDIQTQDEPLIINDLYGVFTAYPFELKTEFKSEQPVFNKILETGWRTARLCANETFMDCPYYEQLQYIGDTRIQALVSLYNTGDNRLMKNALRQISWSLNDAGLTQSRYPSAQAQYIPPFSLWYTGMLNDYFRYADDSAFVREMLPTTRKIISYFEKLQKPNGSLQLPKDWNFTDWVTEWNRGVAPALADGGSANLDMQMILAYMYLAPIEAYFGNKEIALMYINKAENLKNTFMQLYWDETRGLFADTPEKKSFSQHVNALAVLAGLKIDDEAKALMSKVMSDKTLTQATIYFNYYVLMALNKAGLGNDYTKYLDVWKTQLTLGLSTWAESPEPSRSDCHAWGASPNIEFYRTVLGIESAAPCFRKIIITPHLGDIKQVSGKMPHPKGLIKTEYLFDKKTEKWNIKITVPEGVTGELIWDSKPYAIDSINKKWTF
jgi:hypothetical protein